MRISTDSPWVATFTEGAASVTANVVDILGGHPDEIGGDAGLQLLDLVASFNPLVAVPGLIGHASVST